MKVLILSDKINISVLSQPWFIVHPLVSRVPEIGMIYRYYDFIFSFSPKKIPLCYVFVRAFLMGLSEGANSKDSLS